MQNPRTLWSFFERLRNRKGPRGACDDPAGSRDPEPDRKHQQTGPEKRLAESGDAGESEQAIRCCFAIGPRKSCLRPSEPPSVRI